ncbi:methylamine utilization protein [Sphingomonas sp. LT1P40]|uniref:methylamine utilization protein n=1 Tax=Alteristakelama amylovorans TaxID=3096166 RepID=UPI002FCB3E9B
MAVPAHAGDVRLRIVDGTGAPVRDAVVTIHTARPAAAGSFKFPWAAAMTQRNVQFDPHVLIIPVGAVVTFPNFDKVRHHVYSFSKAAKFEIKLFGRDESRSYTFKTAGAVAIGCNIHDAMTGFIKVVDTPYANKTAGDGATVIASVPAGRTRITVWHPRMRAKDQESTLDLDVTAGDLSKLITVSLK